MDNDLIYQVKQQIHKSYNYIDYRVKRLNPLFSQQIDKLHSFRDKHLGERCFIIGNGPSLNQTDLSRLRDEYTFGLNRIYLLFPKLGFTTSYYVSINRLVLTQFADEIAQQIPVDKFTSWENYSITKDISDIFYFYRHNSAGFYKDITQGLWGGATVTYVTMQIAYYMGFQQVILIGVDHSFVTQGKAHDKITTQDYDPNHFDPAYFGKGITWQLPDLETSELAYGLARRYYEETGREILDATIGGKLQIFKKIKYDELWQ
jgi:hypothetical protein